MFVVNVYINILMQNLLLCLCCILIQNFTSIALTLHYLLPLYQKLNAGFLRLQWFCFTHYK